MNETLCNAVNRVLFFRLKDFQQFDHVSRMTEDHFPCKLYMLQRMGRGQLNNDEQDYLVISRLLV